MDPEDVIHMKADVMVMVLIVVNVGNVKKAYLSRTQKFLSKR
jgi:hypothetical protein